MISAGYVPRHADRDTMKAGFKRIEPGMDIGVDLGEKWGMAESLASVLACYKLSALLQKLISGKMREGCCRVIWRESG
jgi:hypothetical protein